MAMQRAKTCTAGALSGRVTLGAMGIAALLIAANGIEKAQGQQNLRPGVVPGEVIILREVESAAFGQSDRVGGPIRARADLRRNAELNEAVTQETQRQLSGVRAVVLTDSRAAGISSGASLGMPQLHQALGSDTARHRGAMSSRSGKAASSLGGGSVSGGVVGVTSGIANTITGALSPLGREH